MIAYLLQSFHVFAGGALGGDSYLGVSLPPPLLLAERATC